jgi:acetyl-CoA synthetase
MYVVSDGEVDRQELMAAMQQRIRTGLNPLFKIADVVVVDVLPRTASAKVMRRSLRDDYRLR